MPYMTHAGFTGPHCKDMVDMCRSNPCKNNAVCLPLKKKFLCKCLPGFIGEQRAQSL